MTMPILPPPLPPPDPKYHRPEYEHRKHKAHRDTIVSHGIVSDIAVSLGELFKLLYRLVTLPVRLAVRWQARRRAKHAAR